MSEEVSETEVAELARTMTLKYGFAGVKMGGAKAGVVAAPRISPEEKQDRLFSFGAILKPLLQARCYVPAADLGTSSEEILHRKGIVSIPDFVANCGGVLAFLVDAREERFAREFLLERVGDKVARLLREAGSKGLSVRVCASKTAEENSMRMKQRAEQEGERPLKRLFLCVLEIYPDPRLARVPLRLLKAWYARKTCR